VRVGRTSTTSSSTISPRWFGPRISRVSNYTRFCTAFPISEPTYVVFDLDPCKGVDVLGCVDLVYLLRGVLARFQLASFPKVSGSKGLHLYVPLNTPVEYAITQPFARTVAELVAKQYPDQIVSEMAKAERIGKVFIDWSQNTDFKTTVGVYSLRAKPSKPFVSLPMTWEELSKARKNRQPNQLYFEPGSALNRLEQVGDFAASLRRGRSAGFIRRRRYNRPTRP
jgi:bifunctional non-homologous end joining protein LigD